MDIYTYLWISISIILCFAILSLIVADYRTKYYYTERIGRMVDWLYFAEILSAIVYFMANIAYYLKDI